MASERFAIETLPCYSQRLINNVVFRELTVRILLMLVVVCVPCRDDTE